jgi:DnaJ-class molecular chaperone
MARGEICHSCGGTGKRECHVCDGRGSYPKHDRYVTCERCYGKKVITCTTCRGSGEV